VLNREDAAKLQKMILALLEDRLRFEVRRETKETSVYELTMEKGTSPKFTVLSFPNSTYGTGIDDPRFKRAWDATTSGQSLSEGGRIAGKDIYMSDLIRLL